MKRRYEFIAAGGLAALAVLAGAGPAVAQEEERITADAVQAVMDNIWVLVAAVLVIFMQAGFALVEAGMTRAKNVANIMMKNLMDFCAGVLAFGAVGFALAFGPGGRFLGTKGWFLDPGSYDFGNLSLPTYFIFQVAFAATSATIVSGAMAERTKFKSYFLYSLAITGFIYPVVVRWTWGGGWLSRFGEGFHDFAGSTVVHSVGGWAALMGAAILGPRIGKYGSDGKPRAIPGHSIPLAVTGAFILLIGWFGFNPGSELAADSAVPAIAVTTLLAGCAGAVSAMITIWVKTGKPDVGMTANGLLAGLVGITAGTAVVDNWGAVAIGAVAGVLVVFSVLFFDRIRVDDPVGAISVHGVCGAWGTLAVGLFATTSGSALGDGAFDGLFHGGGAGRLATQAVGVGAVFLWTVVTAGALFLLLKFTIGLRVSEQEEIEGLDVLEHGSPGYAPDMASVRSSATPATPVRATELAGAGR
ncbi:MAG: ammonium transporter [Acidimicrobiales bacterium]|nr:MAG: ammonium transporter [Acidimicrobiales bacterium]